MMYELHINSQAKKTLERLSKTDRARITEKIILLGDNPDNLALDVRPLLGKPDCYRLRVGKWRIIFVREDDIKVISVEKVKSRGDIYK